MRLFNYCQDSLISFLLLVDTRKRVVKLQQVKQPLNTAMH
jgi:hypothetical protein